MNKVNVILITGPPGVGKTTIVKKISNDLKCDFAGFYTEEVHNAHEQRVGKPRIGKYSVHVQDFEKIALPILGSKKPLLVIDEIGKMELLSNHFEKLIRNTISDVNKNIVKLIATIPSASRTPIPVVELLKGLPGAKIIEITRANRNTVYGDAVTKWLKHMNNV